MNIDSVFLSILNMGMTASVVILAVLAVRGLMYRLPKKFAYMLWLIVGIRLVCPVAISSPLSLFNLPGISDETARFKENTARVSGYNMDSNTSQPGSKKDTVQDSKPKQDVITDLPEDVEKASDTDSHSKQILNTGQMADTKKEPVPLTDISGSWFPYLLRGSAVVWLAGMLLFLLWNVYLTIRMKKRLQRAVKYDGNIYECENIPTPFVMGVFQPKIYIPFRLQESERAYILKHEQYHIRRKDYLVKLAAMLLTAVYWFHPFVWLSYICMVRDMEMSCDEYVVGAIEQDIRINYSESLLGFALNKRYLSMGLLTFGETNTRRRVRNILKFQKQKKWIGVVAVILVLVVGAVCLTNARSDGQQSGNGKPEITNQQPENKTKDGKNKIVVATEQIHGYELRLVHLSEKPEPQATALGVLEGKYLLETAKNDTVLDEHMLEFSGKNTLAFPQKGIRFVVKDYDGDGEKDDFSLGQGQTADPALGNWMRYEFFSIDKNGSIVQLCLSTEDGSSLSAKPGDYSADFEQKAEGVIYYMGLGEEGADAAETMITRVVSPDFTKNNAADIEECYRKWIDKRYPGNVYTAMMQSGKGAKILLVTDNVMSDGTTVFADVYQCVGGNGNYDISFIGNFDSGGSAYPLCKMGQYILAGTHHSSQKLRVDYGVGTLYEVAGMGLDKKTCTLSKYMLREDKEKKLSEKKITEREAFLADYYYDWDKDVMKGEPIVFKKVKR